MDSTSMPSLKLIVIYVRLRILRVKSQKMNVGKLMH